MKSANFELSYTMYQAAINSDCLDLQSDFQLGDTNLASCTSFYATALQTCLAMYKHNVYIVLQIYMKLCTSTF